MDQYWSGFWTPLLALGAFSALLFLVGGGYALWTWAVNRARPFGAAFVADNSHAAMLAVRFALGKRFWHIEMPGFTFLVIRGRPIRMNVLNTFEVEEALDAEVARRRERGELEWLIRNEPHRRAKRRREATQP